MKKNKLTPVVNLPKAEKNSRPTSVEKGRRTAYFEPTYWKFHPTWKFCDMDWNFDYLVGTWEVCNNHGLSDCSIKPVFCVRELQEALKARESKTWKEILTNDVFGDHPIDIDALLVHTPRAVKRLNECFGAKIRNGEILTLCSIAVAKKKRAWGTIDKSTGVFSFLWWDPEHKIWETKR